MPYVRRGGNQNLEIWGSLVTETDIQAIGAVVDLPDITIPEYSGSLSAAILGAIINGAYNTNVAVNWLHQFKLEYSTDGGVNYYTAIDAGAPVVKVQAGSTIWGNIMLFDGTNDIKSNMVSGGTLKVRLAADTHADKDKITLYGLMYKLCLYFR